MKQKKPTRQPGIVLPVGLTENFDYRQLPSPLLQLIAGIKYDEMQLLWSNELRLPAPDWARLESLDRQMNQLEEACGEWLP